MLANHMRLVIVALLLASLTTVSAQQVDHLIPETGPFGFVPQDYYARVQSILWRKMESRPIASVIVLPSFEPEWTVYIYHPEIRDVEYFASDSSASSKVDSMAFLRPDTLKYIVVSAVANKSIWSTWMSRGRSKKMTITPKVSSRQMPIETARAVCEALHSRLKETHYTEKPWGGLDGTSYHFAGWKMYAQTWSPEANTIPDRLVRLVESLLDYTRADDSTSQTMLGRIGAASNGLSK